MLDLVFGETTQPRMSKCEHAVVLLREAAESLVWARSHSAIPPLGCDSYPGVWRRHTGIVPGK